jgi:hypothetical protein
MAKERIIGLSLSAKVENGIILNHPVDGENGRVAQEEMQFSLEEIAVQVLSYKEWRANGFIAEPGTVIENVPPAQLFTTQDWLDATKMARAHFAQENGLPDAYLIEGCIFRHPKEHMGIVPVVLDGNHRAVNAINKQERVIFRVLPSQLPPDTEVWRLTNLVKIYGALAR